MGNGASDGLSDPYRRATPAPAPESSPAAQPTENAAAAPQAPTPSNPPPAEPVASHAPNDTPAPPVDDDVLAGALDDDEEPGDGAAAEALSAEMSAQAEPPESPEPSENTEFNEQDLATAAQESQRAHRPVARQPRKKGFNLKETAVPLFATVGVLLLVPGIWAVCIRAGADVVGSDRDDAKTMALVMLAAWPIAGALLAAAWVFWKQVKRQKAATAATAAGKKR